MSETENCMLKCYDTLKGEYVFVKVNEELFHEVKRSYWREDIQERRYKKRTISFTDLVGYRSLNENIVENVIRDVEREYISKAIIQLEKRQRLLVYYVYFEGFSITEASVVCGISPSYASRLLKKARDILGSLLRDDIVI